MNNKLAPIFRVPLKYSLIGSLLAVILILVFYFSNRHPLLIPIFYDYRIFLFGVFIFFSAKEYKEYYNEGLLHFWEGVVIGVIIYITIGLLVSCFIILFSNLQPEFVQQYIDGTIRGLELNKDQLVGENAQSAIKITEEEYQNQIELLKQVPAHRLAWDFFIKSCIIGFFISFLMAVIMRKTEDRFRNNGKS